MKSAPISVQVPNKNTVLDDRGLISRPWETFFRYIKSLIDPLGYERYFDLENNNSSAADIEGLAFSKENVSQGIIEYLIQRVTTGSGATELVTSGVIHAVYKPTTDAWALHTPWTAGPSTSGITFSITSAGQVQYTSTNISGTPSISKISFRVRTLAGKNSQYSQVEG